MQPATARKGAWGQGTLPPRDFADYGKSGSPLKQALNDPALFAHAYLDHGIPT